MANYLNQPFSKNQHGVFKRKTISTELVTLWDDPESVINKEPHVCKEFGCGRVLSAQEKMFGNKCSDHSKENDSSISIRSLPWVKNHVLTRVRIRVIRKLKDMRVIDVLKKITKRA